MLGYRVDGLFEAVSGNPVTTLISCCKLFRHRFPGEALCLFRAIVHCCSKSSSFQLRSKNSFFGP